jgi:hypothetical protein
MASHTIIVTGMVKIHLLPIGGNVAIGAVAPIMSSGRCVANHTIIIGIAVAKLDRFPLIGCMADGALTRIMSRASRVASGTIFQGGVIDVDLPPVAGLMTS